MVISFFNPSLLFLLPLVTFPVILHLFFQKKPKRLIFSDSRFIKIAIKNVAPKRKIKEWLLLLIRCLLLLLLLLAGARPVIKTYTIDKKNESERIILLIDISYSMKYTDTGIQRIEKIKYFSRELLKNLLLKKSSADITTSDRYVCIILFSDKIDATTLPYFSNEIKYLEGFIDNIKAGNNTTDLVNALSFCYKILNNYKDTKRTVIILSDMAEHTIDESKSSIKEIPEFDRDINLIFVSVNSDKNENVFIENVCIDGTQINVKINNTGTVKKRQAITIKKNENFRDTPVLTDFIDLPENKIQNYNFILPSKNSDRNYDIFKIYLENDALSDDNIYYFFHITEKEINLLALDGDPKFLNSINSETYYFYRALSKDENNIFKIKIVTNEEFENIELFSYNVIFLCNPSGFSKEKSEELESFISSGSNRILIVTGGDKLSSYIEDNRINNQSFLPETIKESLGTFFKGEFKIKDMDKKYFENSDNFEIDKIIFKGIIKLYGGKSLITLDNNIPLLIEKNYGNNKIYIFGSTIDTDWTNLPLKPFFPYFLRKLSGEKQSGEIKNNFLYIGEPIIIHKNYLENKRIKIISPDRKETTVSPENVFEKYIYSETVIPGIYEIKKDNDTIYYAVNLNREKNEGRTSKIPLQKLRRYLTGTNYNLLDIKESTINEILNIIEGKEITYHLILAILLLLGSEMILSKNVKYKL